MDLAILWHFHQPVYRRPGSREYVLPWVDFHTTKNYHQMVRLAEETGYPCTFNVVPCLIEQILDYAEGRAEDPVRRSLEAPPDRLTEADLARLRAFAPAESDPARLQLSALRAYFSPVDALPQDKDSLLVRRDGIFRDLVPSLRRLWAEGRIELTTTPYYHPLTPLVFDSEAAAGHDLPGVRFRRPEDGRWHIERGRDYFAEVFGRRPEGLWPSEGAVSPAVTRAAAEAGFGFAVTDENVLWKSLPGPHRRAQLHRPYRSEGLDVFFRDRELSDLIGFEYKSWGAKEAAADLARRIAERRTDGEDDILVLALDGENPWGCYPENGLVFLRAMYEALGRIDGVHPVRLGDHLARRRPGEAIALVPGTWLGSFAKWIGSPAKNRGWETLARAREACGALEEILVAEGSDWFWWFGDGEPAFDALFLEYIQAAYRRAGLTPPE
jgi:alpha-amylase/alpha-mannosidase (GH57 family)